MNQKLKILLQMSYENIREEELKNKIAAQNCFGG